MTLISTWTIPLAKFIKTDLDIQLRAMQSPGPIQKHHSFSDGIIESCFKAPGMLFKPAGIVYDSVAKSEQKAHSVAKSEQGAHSVTKSEKFHWGPTREGAGKRE